MTKEDIHQKLKRLGLRVTPQRIVVLEAIVKSNHPTADQISNKVTELHPNIATGTIYKILDAFVQVGIIRKIETQSDVMRYDAILQQHHHLHDERSSRIEDYIDNYLDQLVKDHLSKNKIPDFEISDVKIQIIGKFDNSKTNE